MANGIIRTPWTTQGTQVVAGGGQAASFKSASDFMGPGGGDNGLAALARGLGSLGGAMFEVGIKERQNLQDMALMQDVQDAGNRLHEFRNNLMANNQGRFAVNAAQTYQAEFQKEYDGLQKKWQGSGLGAQKYLAQHLGAMGASGYKQMMDYSLQQKEAWGDSLMQGNQAEFMQYASDPWRTPEEIAGAAGIYMRQLDGYYQSKGLDPRNSAWQADQQFRQLMGNNATSQALSLVEGGSSEASRLIYGLPRSSSLPQGVRDLADREAAAQGVDPGLVKAVIGAESGGDQGAASGKGARGLMQLMPGTAGDLGVNPNDPDQNIRGGVSYLNQMLKKYGNPHDALMAYNWGPGNMDKWIAAGRQGDVPAETRNYVRAVMADWQMQTGGRGQGGGGYSMPLANYSRISSSFSPSRKNPVDGVIRPHNGTDLAAPAGTPVNPISGGVVVKASRNKINGNYIVVEHDDGSVASSYSHLQGFAAGLKEGDRVESGQEIGYVGSTGRSTGPHLHLGIRVNGKRVDPEKFLGVQTASVGGPEPLMLAALEPGMAGGEEVVSDAGGVAFLENGLEDDEVIDAEYDILAEGGDLSAEGAGWQGGARQRFDLATTLSDPVLTFQEFASPAQKAQVARAYNAALVRRARQEAAELKQRSLEAQRQLIDMQYDGGLTEDKVVALRDVLPIAQYEKYRDMARNGTPPPDKSNTETYIRLNRMAVNGDPGLLDAIEEALLNHELILPDARSLQTEGQQYQDPVVKLALEDMRYRIIGNEMNPDPADRSSFVNARREAYTYLESDRGKNATAKEKRDEIDAITRRYLIAGENILTVPLPAILVGSRTEPDFKATKEAILASPDLSPELRVESLERLAEMKRLFDKEEAQTNANKNNNNFRGTP